MWTLRWNAPEGVAGIAPRDLRIVSRDCGVSFEQEAARTEREICQVTHIICECCEGNLCKRCKTCQCATSFHECVQKPHRKLWRKGTLYGGSADYQRIIFNLHRKGLPIHIIQTKCDEFIGSGDLKAGDADLIVKTIEAERGKQRTAISCMKYCDSPAVSSEGVFLKKRGSRMNQTTSTATAPPGRRYPGA